MLYVVICVLPLLSNVLEIHVDARAGSSFLKSWVVFHHVNFVNTPHCFLDGHLSGLFSVPWVVNEAAVNFGVVYVCLTSQDTAKHFARVVVNFATLDAV